LTDILRPDGVLEPKGAGIERVRAVTIVGGDYWTITLQAMRSPPAIATRLNRMPVAQRRILAMRFMATETTPDH